MALEVGASFDLTHTFTAAQVKAFADLTGDDNPVHIDPTAVEGTRFEKNIVHGVFLIGLVSRILGRHFPGDGTIYVSQEVRFTAPVYVDETVTVRVTVDEHLEKGRLKLATKVFREDGSVAMTGAAVVLPPRASRP